MKTRKLLVFRRDSIPPVPLKPLNPCFSGTNLVHGETFSRDHVFRSSLENPMKKPGAGSGLIQVKLVNSHCKYSQSTAAISTDQP
jgi:hypothetical protein